MTRPSVGSATPTSAEPRSSAGHALGNVTSEGPLQASGLATGPQNSPVYRANVVTSATGLEVAGLELALLGSKVGAGGFEPP